MRFKTHGIRMTLLLSAYIFLIMILTIFVMLFIVPILDHFSIIPYDNGIIPIASYAIIFVLVGTTLALVSSHIPLHPLNRLIDATNKVAKGDFSVHLEIERPVEFKRVSQSFNSMVDELASIEILRNDFINNFSHEFKTPIISVQGFAKLLKDPNLDEEKRTEYLNIIIDETKRLSDLSNNILYLSKVEVLPKLQDYSEYNLTEQLRQSIVMFMDKMDAKNMDIDFEGMDINITANQELIKQVFINLLDNAVKFSNPYSTIIIRVTNPNDSISISITNDGIALNPDKINRVYDKFYQGDTSHITLGNGLGLSLVKRIVELHNGSIEVIAKDTLTTFIVTLPQQLIEELDS